MPLVSPPTTTPRITRDFISVMSVESIGADAALGTGGSAPAGQNFPSVNLAIFVPFVIPAAITVVKMWVENGTAVAGNLDLGLYDPAGNRLVSKGSTAQATISVVQEFDIADTVLQPGLYYMAIASDTSGITQKLNSMSAGIAGIWRAMGVYEMATAFPLPNPATFAVCARTIIPLFGISTRTLVA